MKKTYQNPEMKIVKVKTAQLLIDSPTTLRIGENVNTAAGAESRRYRGSQWEDE